MKNFLAFCSATAFHRFDIRILAEQTTIFEAWPGAILRNNLLYAASQIDIPDEGISLFDFCYKQFPIAVGHPLYKEIKKGFPPPFYLYTLAGNSCRLPYEIQRNEVLTFSLVLVGEAGLYIPYFIQAIRYMCDKGMGNHSKPFTFIDIHEVSAVGKTRLLASGNENIADYLSFPIKIPCFEKNIPENKGMIHLVFETPISLIKQGRVSKKAGYQEESNGFPGFYQLVRSAAHRIEKLTALYHSPNDIDGYITSHKSIEDYVENAASGVWLDSARIQLVTYSSSRKEGTNKRILLTGYTGEITFSGNNYIQYLPLLRCIEQIGIGEKLSYGFGKIRIEEKHIGNVGKRLKKKEMYD